MGDVFIEKVLHLSWVKPKPPKFKSRFGVTPHLPTQSAKRNYDGAAPELSFPSVESPERKWIARVQAGVLIVNQIEPTFFQETAVRF